MSFSISEKPPLGVMIAQAVGITTSAFLAGQNASISYAGIPAILKAPAPLAARQWRTTYDIGKLAGPGLAIVGTVAAGYVAYHETPGTLPFNLNILATLLFPSIMPYTLICMASVNSKLSSRAETLATADLSDTAVEKGVRKEETVHALLDWWATLNFGRAMITLVGAVAMVWGVVDRYEVVSAGVKFGSGANRLG